MISSCCDVIVVFAALMIFVVLFCVGVTLANGNTAEVAKSAIGETNAVFVSTS